MKPGHLLWEVPVGPTVSLPWGVCFQYSLLLLLIRPTSVPPPLFCSNNLSFFNFHTSHFPFSHTTNHPPDFAHHRRPHLQYPATHPSGHPILGRCSAWGQPWVRWNRCLPGLCDSKGPSPFYNAHLQFFHSNKLPPNNHCLPNLDSPNSPFVSTTPYPPLSFHSWIPGPQFAVTQPSGQHVPHKGFVFRTRTGWDS